MANSRVGFDLPCRRGTRVCPAEVAYFSVEADLTWDFAVDVRTPPWMERISLHTGLDGSESFLASDRCGNRSHRQDRRANRRYPESKPEVQRTAGAQVVMSLKASPRLGIKVPLNFQAKLPITQFPVM